MSKHGATERRQSELRDMKVLFQPGTFIAHFRGLNNHTSFQDFKVEPLISCALRH